MDRRTALKRAVVSIGAAVGGGIAVTVGGYFVSPLFKRHGMPISLTLLGPVSDFEVSSPRSVDFTARVFDGWVTGERPRAAWIVRRSESDFWVYNPHCTHLGCAYYWDEASARFRCPCHGGVFTIDGTVVAGPPPRPLDTMEWEVENGSLYVIYKDFQVGLPQKKDL